MDENLAMIDLAYRTPEPPSDLADRAKREAGQIRRNRRLAGAAAVSALLIVGLAVPGLMKAAGGTVQIAGSPSGGSTAVPLNQDPGFSSPQEAVDAYVQALQSGDAVRLARVLEPGGNTGTRDARIARAKNHPVTVVGVTWGETPSSSWKTAAVEIRDGSVASTDSLLVGPPPWLPPDAARQYKVTLAP